MTKNITSMMTNFIITLSLFWPLPREGLSRFSVLLKSVAYLLHRLAATLTPFFASAFFVVDCCVTSRKARHNQDESVPGFIIPPFFSLDGCLN
ncbi:hypothetical protein TA05_04145 [Citrobacter rodentium]|nr:hypothetical protein TA05_04145 [Citrobacter rodentium]